MDKKQLRKIYDKTDGYCVYCGKKLAFTNYGKNGKHGSWHIEHSNPKIKGGSNNSRNLKPSCIKCNIDKNTKTGSKYKKEFIPKTLGGKIEKALDVKRGSLGASRKQVKRKSTKRKNN